MIVLLNAHYHIVSMSLNGTIVKRALLSHYSTTSMPLNGTIVKRACYFIAIPLA